jgi:RNA-directed DNA polymerase
MSKLKLTVNETKTRVCRLPEEKFDFLGYYPSGRTAFRGRQREPFSGSRMR